MARSVALLTVLAILLGLPPGEGRAGVPPLRLLVQPGSPPVATLIVLEVPVLRLRASDAEARGAEVLRRLAEILGQRPGALTVDVRPGIGAADLLLNGRHLVTADPDQARANRTTPEALAGLWADRLRQALARNAVTLLPNVVVLRVGQSAAVSVSAFLPGAIVLGPYDERVAIVRVVSGGLEVDARALGSTTVPVRVGGGRALLSVAVRREAGTIPEVISVRVTGDFANTALVREAVERRLEQVVVREAGATLRIGPVPSYEVPDAGTETLALAVPVRVQSPNALPVERIVRVEVVRERVAVRDPALLLVSNRPEAVLADGILFAETVEAGQPVRFLYHHQNGTPDYSRVLTVVVTNPGARPAEVLLISGLAGPSPDPLFAGHAATVRFVQNLVAGRGYVLEIAPRSSHAFIAQTMLPLQLVSGILQWQVLRGDDLEVRVQVRLPWLLERTVALPINQIAYPHPKGVFPAPTVTVARTVQATQTAALVELGGTAGLRDLRTGEALIGDYGVVYRLTVTLTNPLPRDVQTDLVAAAAGGPARGIFLVDGRPIEAALFRPLEERVLATVTIPAAQATTVQIVTMPSAGSYYPVRLSLRPREAP